MAVTSTIERNRSGWLSECAFPPNLLPSLYPFFRTCDVYLTSSDFVRIRSFFSPIKPRNYFFLSNVIDLLLKFNVNWACFYFTVALLLTDGEENVPPSHPNQQSSKKRGKLFHKPFSLTALLSSGKSVSHLLWVCCLVVFLVLEYHLRACWPRWRKTSQTF